MPDKQEYLKIKADLKHIIQSINFCCFCFQNANNMHRLVQNIVSDNLTVGSEVQISELFGSKFQLSLPSYFICTSCKRNLDQAYKFIKNVRRSMSTLNHCLEQLEKEVSNTENTIQASKFIANVVILLADATEIKEMAEDTPKIKTEWIDAFESNSDNSDNEVLATYYKKIKTNKKLKKRKKIKTQVSCDYCHMSFSKHALSKHMKLIHKTSKILFCPDCQENPCPHEKYLEYVQKKRQSYGKYPCMDCEKIVTEKVLLISHINNYHLKLFPYLCELCGASFPSKRNQIYHMERYHRELNTCSYCELELRDKDLLAQHEKSCKNLEKPHKCHLCNSTFPDLDKLINHTAKHNSYPCKECTKVCTTKHNLRMHSICHMNKEERITMLKNRGIRPRKPNKKRIKTINTTMRKCYLCPAQLTNRKTLVYHLRTNHTPDEKYSCKDCNKIFDTRKGLLCHLKNYLHMRKVNPDYQPTHKCIDCNATFTLSSQLEKHRNIRHLKVLPYRCEICDRSFAAKFNLNAHLIRHKGNKKFQCNYCSALFTEQNGLKSHILRHHAPEKKPCACEICGATFICMSECKMHQLRKHSERNFGCPLCEGKYHTNSNLRSHIKKVHFKGKTLAEYMEDVGFSKDLNEVFRDRRLPFIETQEVLKQGIP